jgi:hypothetical protein
LGTLPEQEAMMEYDKKTLQAVLILLTENPDGRTEAYEHTVNWIKTQLNEHVAPAVPKQWERYDA